LYTKTQRPHLFNNRWPREAAKKVASRSEFYDTDETEITIYLKEIIGKNDADDQSQTPVVHVYRGTRTKTPAPAIPKFRSKEFMWVASIEKIREEKFKEDIEKQLSELSEHQHETPTAEIRPRFPVSMDNEVTFSNRRQIENSSFMKYDELMSNNLDRYDGERYSYETHMRQLKKNATENDVSKSFFSNEVDQYEPYAHKYSGFNRVIPSQYSPYSSYTYKDIHRPQNYPSDAFYGQRSYTSEPYPNESSPQQQHIPMEHFRLVQNNITLPPFHGYDNVYGSRNQGMSHYSYGGHVYNKEPVLNPISNSLMGALNPGSKSSGMFFPEPYTKRQ
jgi:hypothetical protein